MSKITENFLQDYYEHKALEHDEISLTYDHKSAYKRYFYRSRFAAIMTALDPRKDDHILDLGCGTGYYSKAILQAGSRVTAVEYSANYLEQARTYIGANDNVQYVKASATELPFKDSIFDKVLFTEIIEHLPSYKDSVDEIYRVLKPGGVAVITTPSKFSPMNIAYYLKRWKRKYEFNEHVHEFTYLELKRLLGAKFKIVSYSMSNYVIPYPLDNLILEITSDNNLWIRATKHIDSILSRLPAIRHIGWTMIFSVRKEIK